MEEYFNPLAVTHLLQHTLRSLCIHENSLWVYAVFWRILPRNYPPPNWHFQGGAYDWSRGNRRNWMLAWEDGFCNFLASRTEIDFEASSYVDQYNDLQHLKGLQPELFFKMSHEIYNYGECLIGKVAADQSHKWVYKEHSNQAINLSAWQNSKDTNPRTWGAQFQSGIKTIALIAVKGGVLQLGAVKKVTEDLSYVFQLQKKFSDLHRIPGFLLPHPSALPEVSFNAVHGGLTAIDFSDYFNQSMMITPSMNSLEALLSKLPSVIPTPTPPPPLFQQYESQPSLPKTTEIDGNGGGSKEGDQ